MYNDSRNGLYMHVSFDQFKVPLWVDLVTRGMLFFTCYAI